MRTIHRVFATALLALLAAGCTVVPRVYSNADPGADLASYRTFGFVERAGTDRGEYTSLLTRHLQTSTRRELEARGYRFSADNPELLVNFNLATTSRLEPQPGAAFGWGGYYPYRWGGYHPWSGWSHPPVREVHEGTLNIDLVDAAERRLVWEGMAVSRLGTDHHVQRDAMVEEAVTAIFARFPWQARR